jgi:Glu-tRNA(Gln) amidotransferase subunit E-like FAD-binding protein
MSLTGSIRNVDFEDREFDEISNILEEFFENESDSYNIFQTNKQLKLFAEDIEEIRNIVSTASKRFDGKIKEGLSKITIILPSSAASASALDSSDEERQWLSKTRL